jgi:hypothetical protein
VCGLGQHTQSQRCEPLPEVSPGCFWWWDRLRRAGASEPHSYVAFAASARFNAHCDLNRIFAANKP